MSDVAGHAHRIEQAPQRREAAPRHLKVVERAPRSAASRQRQARLVLVSGVSAAVAIVFGLVCLHVVLAQRQLQLDKLTTVATQDRTTYQNLRLKVSSLESPEHIISTAEGKLGMRQPATVTYVSPPPGSPTVATAPFRPKVAPAPGKATEAPAPSGDADWPQVKAALAGAP